MKKFFSLMLVLATMIGGLTACSDDDDDTDYAAEIAGTYTGSAVLVDTALLNYTGTWAGFDLSESSSIDATVTISKSGDGTVNVKFGELYISYTTTLGGKVSATLGEFTISNLNVWHNGLTGANWVGTGAYTPFETTTTYKLGSGSDENINVSGKTVGVSVSYEKNGFLQVKIYDLKLGDKLPVGFPLTFTGNKQ